MKRKSIIRTVITIVAIVLVFALISWILTNNKKKNEEKVAVVAQTSGNVAVRTSVVKKQSLEQDFTVNGNFTPAQQLNFSAENSGRVIKVLADEGSVVMRGQVLAIINADQLNVDLSSAEATYQNALKDKQRYENAFATGGVTQQQVDQAKLTLSNAQTKVAQAKIKVGDANVRSSINGVVNKRMIEPGAVVAPGTELFELVDVSSLKLNVSVNENQVANLSNGDSVTVTASVFPDKTFSGKITFIAAKADNTLSFPLEITVASNPGGKIKAGMYGSAVFQFPGQAPAIMVPRSAFVGSVSSNQLFVMKADSSAELRKVTPGRIAGEQVEILQGLQEGETVITSGQINLSNGSKVAPIK